MQNFLRLDTVSLTYYSKTMETEALKEVSFEVNEGEFVAIVGPSGCGKTTLLSLVCGIMTPTKGKIYLINKEVTGVSSNVGYMLQRDYLFEWRTIQKNILLGLEIQKKLTSKNIERVNNLIEKYGLKEFAKSYPNQLSGGMRQRAALIRTLATDPDILLLDEPFSALDFQTRLNVCDDVYRIIKKEQKTVLLVTHDISEAISMADKIIVLSKRPASIKDIHYTNMGHISSPLKRRETNGFAQQFEKIWQELNDYETQEGTDSITQAIS